MTNSKVSNIYYKHQTPSNKQASLQYSMTAITAQD